VNKPAPISPLRVASMFPNASKAVRELNSGPAEPVEIKAYPTVGKRRKQMNKTEAEFSRMLEARKSRGEIIDWQYEGVTLRWGIIDPIKYTPDFLVFEEATAGMLRLALIETKGAHIWPKDMQKFKAARNEWPLLSFSMWQRSKGEWRQIL
jgi:hypothetical protein